MTRVADATTSLALLAQTLREYPTAGFAWLTRLAADIGSILATGSRHCNKRCERSPFSTPIRAMATLVVCPTSLVTNWENAEARKFTPEAQDAPAGRSAESRRPLPCDRRASTIAVTQSYATLLRRDIDTSARESAFSPPPVTRRESAACTSKTRRRTTRAGRLRSLRANPSLRRATDAPMENSVRDLTGPDHELHACPGIAGNPAPTLREGATELPDAARGSRRFATRRSPAKLAAFCIRRRKRERREERSARENRAGRALQPIARPSTRPPTTLCCAKIQG